jgi:hypothetical protein
MEAVDDFARDLFDLCKTHAPTQSQERCVARFLERPLE